MQGIIRQYCPPKEFETIPDMIKEVNAYKHYQLLVDVRLLNESPYYSSEDVRIAPPKGHVKFVENQGDVQHFGKTYWRVRDKALVYDNSSFIIVTQTFYLLSAQLQFLPGKSSEEIMKKYKQQKDHKALFPSSDRSWERKPLPVEFQTT